MNFRKFCNAAIAFSVCVFGLVSCTMAQMPIQYRVIMPNTPTDWPAATEIKIEHNSMMFGSPLVVGWTMRTDRPGLSGYSAFVYDHGGYINPANTYVGSASATGFWDGYDLVGPPEEWDKNWDDPTVHETYNQLAFIGINSNGIAGGLLWSDTATPRRIPVYLDLNPLAGTMELKRIPLPANAAGGRVAEVTDNDEILVRLFDENGQDVGTYIYKPSIAGSKEERIEIPALAGMKFDHDRTSLNSMWQILGRLDGVDARFDLGNATLLEDTPAYRRYSVDSVDIESFPELDSLSGPNESGQFAARLYISKGKDKGTYGVRYSGSPASEEKRWMLETWSNNPHVVDGINDDGDVLGRRRDANGDYTYYYDEAGPGPDDDLYIPSIMDLVTDDSDPDFLFRHGEGSDLTVGKKIFTEADSTGFSWLGGIRNVSGQGERFYVLQPVVPGQTPGITVSPVSGLTTTEAGETTSFSVVLNSEPIANVTIGISSSNTAEGTVSASSLTFTPTNWNQAQSITITGVDDSLEDGDVAYSIITAAATSADPEYNGLDPADVSVSNEDDDGQSGGGTKTYSSGNINLNIPDNNPIGASYTIGVGSGDAVQIISLTVTLNISHPRPSDLTVTMMGPDGTEVTLTNFSGDNNVTAFNGISSQGLWTLNVVDSRKKKEGTFDSWSIMAQH